MKFMLVLLIVGCATHSKEIARSNNLCQESSEHRMKAVASINTLTELAKVWADHNTCIDGASAEKYAESVSELLDKKWSHVISSSQINDPLVLNALISGVSETWEFKLSRRVRQLAEYQCSKEAEELCRRILKIVPKTAPTRK